MIPAYESSLPLVLAVPCFVFGTAAIAQKHKLITRVAFTYGFAFTAMCFGENRPIGVVTVGSLLFACLPMLFPKGGDGGETKKHGQF